jgi:CHAD domain-containing protein
MSELALVGLLDKSAVGAATAIVAARLDVLVAECRRLESADDPDALHDFRVALRRLRSAMRAYRPWLGEAASRKLRARLRDLGRTTNEGRDGQVQAAWIEGLRSELGAEALVRRFRKLERPRLRRVRKEVLAVVERIRSRLPVDVGDSAPFRDVVRPLFLAHVDDVASRLAAVRDLEQVDAIHEARIAAKRLRYLLEPLTADLPGAKESLARLERLQDLLGEVHDAHVFEDVVASVGGWRGRDRAAMTPLRAHNEARCRAAFDALAGDGWLGAGPQAFFDGLRSLLPATLAQK